MGLPCSRLTHARASQRRNPGLPNASYVNYLCDPESSQLYLQAPTLGAGSGQAVDMMAGMGAPGVHGSGGGWYGGQSHGYQQDTNSRLAADGSGPHSLGMGMSMGTPTQVRLHGSHARPCAAACLPDAFACSPPPTFRVRFGCFFPKPSLPPQLSARC